MPAPPTRFGTFSRNELMPHAGCRVCDSFGFRMSAPCSLAYSWDRRSASGKRVSSLSM